VTILVALVLAWSAAAGQITVTASVAPVEAELKAKLEREPRHIPHYLALARLYSDIRHYHEAEATLRRALVIKPDAREVYGELFLLFHQTHHFEKGLPLADAWERIAPADPEAPTMRAGAYFKLAERDRPGASRERLDFVARGLAAADAALSLNPDYGPAVYAKIGLVSVKASLVSDTERRALESERQALIDRLENLKSRR
jgi:tetratricopeptide (TPR) repeat protein